MNNSQSTLQAEIFDDYAIVDVRELSRLCAVDNMYIVELVEEGILAAEGAAGEWRFPGAALRRARLALRLHRDLEINMPGVALAMQLMEQIERLRSELDMRR